MLSVKKSKRIKEEEEEEEEEEINLKRESFTIRKKNKFGRTV